MSVLTKINIIDCGSKEDYILAKKVAKRSAFAVKKKAEKEKMKDI